MQRANILYSTYSHNILRLVLNRTIQKTIYLINLIFKVQNAFGLGTFIPISGFCYFLKTYIIKTHIYCDNFLLR